MITDNMEGKTVGGIKCNVFWIRPDADDVIMCVSIESVVMCLRFLCHLVKSTARYLIVHLQLCQFTLKLVPSQHYFLCVFYHHLGF